MTRVNLFLQSEKKRGKNTNSGAEINAEVKTTPHPIHEHIIKQDPQSGRNKPADNASGKGSERLELDFRSLLRK